MSSSGRWAEETARIIVESRSLYARAHGEPFFYSSGWASPLYIDCKKLISSPADRNTLVEMMIEKLSESLDLDALEVVAGCELSGIPFRRWSPTDFPNHWFSCVGKAKDLVGSLISKGNSSRGRRCC